MAKQRLEVSTTTAQAAAIAPLVWCRRHGCRRQRKRVEVKPGDVAAVAGFRR